MSTEENKEAKKRYFAAFNAQNLDAIDDLFAPDYVLHMAGSRDIEGREMLKGIVADSLASLSDARLTVDDMVAEGDKVVTRWTMTAIHSGEFMGVPPTHRPITAHGIIIDRFVEGRVVEAWESFDMHGLLTQLEALTSDG